MNDLEYLSNDALRVLLLLLASENQNVSLGQDFSRVMGMDDEQITNALQELNNGGFIEDHEFNVINVRYVKGYFRVLARQALAVPQD